jgi:two-component system NtrC family response regulator
LGGNDLVKVDVRVVCATNRDLRKEVETRRFREDLYYRLNVVNIRVPPLRERRADIPLLSRYFLHKYSEKYARSRTEVSDQLMALFLSYDWPGNVRELENAVERMLILRRGEVIGAGDLPPQVRGQEKPAAGGVLNLPAEGYSLEALEKEAVLEALVRNDWNQTRAAAFLRIPRHILIYRIEKFGIKKA